MVRTTVDGYLSLNDLIQDWTNTGTRNACHQIHNLELKDVLPQRDKVCFGQGNLSHAVTAEEWDEIKLCIPQRLIARSIEPPNDLYALQYSTVWDSIKIGRSSNVQSRIRCLEKGHNFRMVLLAVYPGKGHLERHVHQQLKGYQSSFGAGNEWFDLSADYALKVISEVIQQSQEESLPFLESEP